MAWSPNVGGFVKYRTAAGRVRHAVITAVTNPTTINLRVGNGATKFTASASPKVARKGVTVGWFH